MNIAGAMTILVHVVEQGGFRRAAVALGVSTSVISSSIQSLEDHFRTRLLVRTTRQLCLTEDGHRVYAFAREFTAGLHNLEASFLDERNVGGCVTVEASPWVLKLLVLPHITKFHELFPAISLKLFSRQHVFGGKEEDADIVLRHGPFGNSQLVGVELGYLIGRYVASPEYLKAHGAPRHPDELKHHQCLGYMEQGTMLRWRFKDGRTTHVMDLLQHTLIFNDAELILAAAIAGHGIAHLSDVQVRASLESGQLVPVLSQFEVTSEPLTLLYRKRPPPSPAVKIFKDFLSSLYPRNKLIGSSVATGSRVVSLGDIDHRPTKAS